MSELRWINGTWKSIPALNSIVVMSESGLNSLKDNEIYHHGSKFVFLGEIHNMQGSCIVVSILTGRVFCMMETDHFVEEVT